MRGRSRKNTNPLNKSYESNGPDVKIRGTAQHIAEKYQQLARDSQASGDRVMAENYLQHAEHYLRIVASAQPPQQQQQQQALQNGQADKETQSAKEPETAEAVVQTNGAEAVMPADAPQPFVDVSAAPQPHRNGADTAGDAEPAAAESAAPVAEDADGDASGKSRRRTRGTRGRGTRRPPPRREESDEQSSEPKPIEAASEPAESEASEPSEPQPQPAPPASDA